MPIKRFTRLHFNNFERDGAGVDQAVHLAQWDVGGLVFGEEQHFGAISDFGRAFDHNPVLGTVVVLLQAEAGAGLDLNALDLEAAIHVVDLAQGHLCALRVLAESTHTGAHVYNLGTGQGYSVLQMVRAFEAASGRPVPYHIAPRRPGDIATCYANPAKAERELGWKAQRGLDEMMQDAWRWVQNNPDGYKSANSN